MITKQEYLEEGLRRMRLRKAKRNAKYRDLVQRADGNPIYCGKPGAYWPDSNSPTGYSQKCDWQGICQYPCNGDC